MRFLILILSGFFALQGCGYVTHQTLSKDTNPEASDPEPDYKVSLDEDYQALSTYIYMGNRVENFATYFNVYYTAQQKFDEAVEEHRTSTIAYFNKNIDSLNFNPTVQETTKDKLKIVITRASKVLEYHKNSRFLDDAVLLIGKSFYMQGDYLQAERKFNEFLSKLSSSELSEEALLYLGRSQLQLRKYQEAQAILTKLMTTAKNPNIRSEASQELGNFAASQKDYNRAIDFYSQAIGFAQDKESKAEKQFVLGKIYSQFSSGNAASSYQNAANLTSNFDLKFYSRLNYGKALRIQKNYPLAYQILNELNSSYRDYPEYKQLAELEIANVLLAQGNTSSMNNYYKVIIDYPGTPTAADAYYYIAKHYEEVKKDYFRAVINYKKAYSENAASIYNQISAKKSNVLERYFTLRSTINNVPVIEIPNENEELERYRREYQNLEGTEPPPPGFDPPGSDPKGGGTSDSIDAQQQVVFNAYLQISELFLYELNQQDSAEIYLKNALSIFNDENKAPVILYTLASLYRNAGRNSEADEMFRDILNRYPGSEFTASINKQLGIASIDTVTSSVDQSFNEALQYLQDKNYAASINTLNAVFTANAGTDIAARSLYTIGFIYENELLKPDSAYHYYKQLTELFPQSSYTETVKMKVSEYSTGNVNNTPPEVPKKEEEEIRTPEQETTDPSIKAPEEKIIVPEERNEEKLSPEEIERLLREEEEKSK